MVKRRLALLPLAAGLCAAFPAQAAWDFTPQASARVTWSDNLGRLPDERAESGIVLELTPGFQLENHSPRFQFRMAYALHLYQYAGHRPPSAQRHSQSLRSDLRSRLVDELLFLDAQAAVSQQTVSAFGPLGGDSDYLRNNRNEVRSYQVSPYLVHRFGAFANGELRYRHDAVSSDNIGFRRSTGNTVSASLASGPSFRRFGWTASVSRGVVEDKLPPTGERENEQTSSSKNANLALRYAASPQLNVGVFGGYDSYDFDGLGGAQSGAAYGASVDWTPSARTSLKASAGHRFYGPSYSLALQHRSRGTVWNIAYSDAVSSTRSQFVLPQAVDTAAMLDNLFRAQIPDAALRAAIVQAYMQSSGLPPTLPNSVNFLSNRYSLLKQLNASMAWQLARTTSVLTVFKSRREMLSSQAVDSTLLGNTFSSLNDNTEQLGVSASVSYRIGPHTTAALAASAVNVESLTVARDNRHRDVRAHLARNFGARASAMVEVRRARGNAGLGGQQYTENVVSAVLTAKF